MKRTSIFLDEAIHEVLRRLAFERRLTIGELIRRATMEWLEREGELPKKGRKRNRSGKRDGGG